MHGVCPRAVWFSSYHQRLLLWPLSDWDVQLGVRSQLHAVPRGQVRLRAARDRVHAGCMPLECACFGCVFAGFVCVLVCAWVGVGVGGDVLGSLVFGVGKSARCSSFLSALDGMVRVYPDQTGPAVCHAARMCLCECRHECVLGVAVADTAGQQGCLSPHAPVFALLGAWRVQHRTLVTQLCVLWLIVRMVSLAVGPRVGYR